MDILSFNLAVNASSKCGVILPNPSFFEKGLGLMFIRPRLKRLPRTPADEVVNAARACECVA